MARLTVETCRGTVFSLNEKVREVTSRLQFTYFCAYFYVRNLYPSFLKQDKQNKNTKSRKPPQVINILAGHSIFFERNSSKQWKSNLVDPNTRALASGAVTDRQNIS